MKNYKQILEAIHKGVLLALDGMEDIEVNNSISDIINTEDVIQLKIDLNEIVVDLGLPSGTLWCKYNLGVDINKLYSYKDWNGDYYAWGEIKSNKYNGYIYDTYKYCWHSYKELTKYCPVKHSEYGHDNFSDDLTLLLPEDDAAYQNMHYKDYKFHIPTKELFEELKKYTTSEHVIDYEFNGEKILGLNGRVFKGKNGNELFIPYAGYKEWSNLKCTSGGYLWSSDICLYPPCAAWRLHINRDGVNIDSDAGRYNGYVIRPVLNKSSLYESTINLAIDDFDFNNNEELNNTNDIIDTNNLTIALHIVKLINNIEIKNIINIDPIIKRDIRKLYKRLKIILNGEKYIATSREKLKELIRHIVIINPKEDLNWIDTSHITSMYAMFDDFISKHFCGDVSEWDMSNVTNTRNMFYRCEKFNCDISKWDVSNVKVMGSMFAECYKFNQDLSKWDVSNVTEMSCVFSGCHNFNCDLSKWDVSNVTDMAWMFSRCYKFNLDISKWNVSNVTRNNGFYYKAKFALTPEWVPNFDLEKTMGNA